MPENYILLPPLPNNVSRPLWSVLIPTYNCARYLSETLESILEQDLGPEQMEILVIDDYSTKDNPENVVNKIGRGRVEFIKQSKNVGKVKNFETGLLRSKGILIHQLHGDDKVLPGFYQKMTNLFQNNTLARAGFCRVIYIDENSKWQKISGIEKYEGGLLENWFEKMIVAQNILTPSMVVKREVYESIGTFDRRLDCMEDWEMWIRVSYYYNVAYLNEVLAEYRIHSTSTSAYAFNDGGMIKDFNTISDILHERYGKKINKKLLNQRKRNHDMFLIENILHQKLTLEAKLKLLMNLPRYVFHPTYLFRIIHFLLK